MHITLRTQCSDFSHSGSESDNVPVLTLSDTSCSHFIMDTCPAVLTVLCLSSVKVRGVSKKYKPEIILSLEIIAILNHAPSFIFRLTDFIQSLLGRTGFLCWMPWTFRHPLRYQPSLLCHARDTWVWFSSSRGLFITREILWKLTHYKIVTSYQHNFSQIALFEKPDGIPFNFIIDSKNGQM